MLILVTGFEPFGQAETNASWEAVSRLPDHIEVRGRFRRSVNIERRLLPVSYGQAGAQIRHLIDTLRPEGVILTGVDATRPNLSIEDVAVNEQRSDQPDNDGVLASGRAVVPGGPEHLYSTAQVSVLVEAIEREHMSVELSEDAGRYVCNSTYYWALHEAASLDRSALHVRSPQVVFVHVPPESVVPTSDLEFALEVAIEQLAEGIVATDRRVRAEVAASDRHHLVVGQAVATRLRDVELPTSRAPRIGISGGIGAGKSTVTQVFRQAGSVIADADELARQVVEPGTAGLSEVVAAFGPQVLAGDGSLDRRALGAVVFADDQARARLEAITHPRIGRAARDLMRSAPSNSLAVYDIPLLVETGVEGMFDVVIMVDAPLSARLARLEERGLSTQQASERIAAQADLSQRRRAATVWIDNDGTEEELRLLVSDIMKKWLDRR